MLTLFNDFNCSIHFLMKVIIDRLYLKLENLVSRFNQINKENKELSNLLTECRKKLDQKDKYIDELEEKNRILKISSFISSDKNENKSSKKKINELVREIDKCMAMLNK